VPVEFCHSLVVDDPSWRPSPDTAARVMSVMMKWGLVESLTCAVDLTPGNFRKIEPADISCETGHGMAFFFRPGKAPAVAQVGDPDWFGPEVTDNCDDFKIALILGEAAHRNCPSPLDSLRMVAISW
jgi:hypothetical protein